MSKRARVAAAAAVVCTTGALAGLEIDRIDRSVTGPLAYKYAALPRVVANLASADIGRIFAAAAHDASEFLPHVGIHFGEFCVGYCNNLPHKRGDGLPPPPQQQPQAPLSAPTTCLAHGCMFGSRCTEPPAGGAGGHGGRHGDVRGDGHGGGLGLGLAPHDTCTPPPLFTHGGGVGCSEHDAAAHAPAVTGRARTANAEHVRRVTRAPLVASPLRVNTLAVGLDAQHPPAASPRGPAAPPPTNSRRSHRKRPRVSDDAGCSTDT